MNITEELKQRMIDELNKIQSDAFDDGYRTCAKEIIHSLSEAPKEWFSKDKILCFMEIVLKKINKDNLKV